MATLGRDSVIVRQAQLVLKDIQLAPAESGECDPEEADEEPCTPLEPGPVLLDLPLDDTAVHRVTVPAPAGTFVVFHLAIVSVRVAGTFSRSGARREFVYSSDFNEEQEAGLLPPLIVHPDDTTNLTLRLDLATWFLSAAKTALIDPSTANAGQPNASLVHDNIRTSLTVSHDDERPAPTPPRATSPWPRDRDTTRFAMQLARDLIHVPRCRPSVPRITPDSIGPFRLEESLSALQRNCPGLLYGWAVDPDGFPVPAVAARLGGAIVTALLSDTIPTATVHRVTVQQAGPRTAAGIGVGSTLRDLRRAYGAPGSAEPGCVLHIWFASLPGVAFHMKFPPRERRECGGLSEEPLPPDLRVATVLLVPR
jgi:hypothetical protein